MTIQYGLFTLDSKIATFQSGVLIDIICPQLYKVAAVKGLISWVNNLPVGLGAKIFYPETANFMSVTIYITTLACLVVIQ